MNVPQQMAAFRPQMLSYATRQLGDDSLAEDVVQDAYVAAFDKASAFRGEAALKTWVFAILKHKVADALRGRYRRQAREVSCDFDDDPDGDALEALLFRQDGHWEADGGPGNLGNPEQLLTNREFWQVLQRCLAGLPGMFVALAAGPLTRRLGGSTGLARTGFLVAGLGLVAEALAPESMIGLGLASLLFVTGIALAVPAMIALFGQAAAPRRGSGMAINGFVLFIGASLGPVLATAGLSFTILLLIIALLLGIAAVFVTLSARAAASATAKSPKES